MTAADSLQGWMGEAPKGADLEGRELLARLRRDMFGATVHLRLGRYEGLQEIGRGGMGIVYRARDRELRRDVAIKVLRAEHPSATARLRREARAMARLSHPNVVQILAVGVEDGRTYIVMELVAGIDAAQWLRQRPRSATEILEVFVAAGRGLAAAHAAGIVHRDFKPANVLVGDHLQNARAIGRVRVTDFGLAGDGSEISSKLGESSGGSSSEALTRTGTRLGTPRYMAPEQRRGGLVDARVDQYSLAVSLWEALYGEHRRHGPIAGACPPSPTSRRVRAALRRALADDPERRHASLDALLDELKDPGRPRWRPAVSAAAIGGAAIVAAMSAWPEAHAPGCDAEERAIAVWSPARAHDLRAHLREIDPGLGEAFATGTAARIDAWALAWRDRRTATCGLGSAATREPERRCLTGALYELERTLVILGEADRATAERSSRMIAELPDPRECARAEPPRDELPPAVANELEQRLAEARARKRGGQYRAAATLAERAVALAMEHDGASWRASAEYELGHALISATGGTEGEASLLFAFHRAEADEDEELAARAAIALLNLATTRADHAAAATWSRHAETWLSRLGDPPPLRCELAMARVDLRVREASWPEAFAELDRASEACDRGPGSPYAGRIENQRGQAELGRHAYDAAAAAFQRAVDAEVEMHGRSHSNVANSLNNLGVAAWYLGDHDAAEAAYRETLEIRRAVLGEDHPKTAISLMNLGILAQDQRSYEEALELLREAERRTRRALGDEHPQVAQILQNQGVTLGRLADFEGARRVEEEGLRIYEAAFGADHPQTLEIRLNLAATTANAGDDAAAIEVLVAAADMIVRTQGARNDAFGNVLRNLAISYRRLDHPKLALRFAEDALETMHAALGPRHPEVAETAITLASTALAAGRPERAVWAANVGRAIGLPTPRSAGLAALHLAQGLEALGREQDAIPSLLQEARAQFALAGALGEPSDAMLRRWAAAHGYRPD